MSAEFWAIITVGAMMLGIGVTLGILLYSLTGGLRGEIADLRERISRIEGMIDLIVRGLHVEIKGQG